jgi:hypothetical protein
MEQTRLRYEARLTGVEPICGHWGMTSARLAVVESDTTHQVEEGVGLGSRQFRAGQRSRASWLFCGAGQRPAQQEINRIGGAQPASWIWGQSPTTRLWMDG